MEPVHDLETQNENQANQGANQAAFVAAGARRTWAFCSMQALLRENRFWLCVVSSGIVFVVVICFGFVLHIQWLDSHYEKNPNATLVPSCSPLGCPIIINAGDWHIWFQNFIRLISFARTYSWVNFRQYPGTNIGPRFNCWRTRQTDFLSRAYFEDCLLHHRLFVDSAWVC